MALTMTSNFIVAIRAVDGASGPLTGIAKAFSSLGNSMQRIGLGMTALVTAPIMGAGTAAAKLATDYDKSMRNIQSISKATDQELASLSQRFTTMSTDISRTLDTPQKLAEAFYEIQSAGFTGEEGEKVLGAATKAATAGLADTTEVAVALTNALNAYGVGAEQATRFTDAMVRSVDTGVFHFADLTQQMGDWINTAAQLDIPIEQALAALSTMTKKGIKMPEASTSLNRILTQFLKPSPKAAAAAAELGIELSSNTIKSIGLANALKLVNDRTKLVSIITKADKDERIRAIDAQIAQTQSQINWNRSVGQGVAPLRNQLAALKTKRQAIKNDIFDTMDYTDTVNEMAKASGVSADAIAAIFPDMRALRGMMALLDDDTKMYTQDLERQNSAAGTTASVFATQTRSFDAQMKNFKNNIQVAGIALGNELMPMVIEISQALIPLVSRFTALDGVTKRGIIVFGALAAAAGPVLIITGLLVQSFAILITNVFALFGMIGKLGGVVAGIGTVLAGISTPLLVIAAVLGVLFVAWRNDWFGMRDVVNEAVAGMLPKIGELLTMLGQRIPSALQEMSKGWRRFNEMMQAVGKSEFERKLVDLKHINEQLATTDMTPEWRAKFVAEQQNLTGYVDHVRKEIGRLQQLESQAASLDIVPPDLARHIADWQKHIREHIGDMDIADVMAQNVEEIGTAAQSAAPAVGIDLANVGTSLATSLGDGFAQLLPWLNDLGKQAVSALMGKDTALSTDVPRPAGFGALKDELWGETPADPFGLQAQNAAYDAAYAQVLAELNQLKADLENTVGDGASSGFDNAVQYFDTAPKAKLASDLEGLVRGAFSQGINDSIGLIDLRSGVSMAPGAGGPFEDIFRIQDIAAAKERGKGTDTEKWLDMFFPGMNLDAASAAAKEIVKKFQLGLLEDPDVKRFINFEGLVDNVMLQTVAEQQLSSLSAAIAGVAAERGADPTVVNAVLGRMGLAPNSPAPNVDPAIQNVLTSMDASIISNAAEFSSRGEELWDLFEKGVINKARQSGLLQEAVDAAFLSAVDKHLGGS